MTSSGNFFSFSSNNIENNKSSAITCPALKNIFQQQDSGFIMHSSAKIPESFDQNTQAQQEIYSDADDSGYSSPGVSSLVTDNEAESEYSSSGTYTTLVKEPVSEKSPNEQKRDGVKQLILIALSMKKELLQKDLLGPSLSIINSLDELIDIFTAKTQDASGAWVSIINLIQEKPELIDLVIVKITRLLVRENFIGVDESRDNLPFEG